MTDKPDLRELVGEDLSPEERARLERVHDLLVTAGPPPELPPQLVEPDLEPRDRSAVSFLPRRRAGLMLGLAAAIALIAFLGGFIAGRAKDTFSTAFDVPMHGTARASNATATIHVGELDHGALVGGQLLERAVHTPRGPRGLGALRRAGVGRLFLGHVDRGLGARTAAVGDRVSRDGVEPRRAGPPFGPVAAGRPPDRSEGLLDRVLGAPTVAEPAQREAENRPGVPPVEDL